MKARYSHIDVAKGIGILFIVLGHYWGGIHGIGEVYRIIYSFHVPLFFFLSGVLMDYSNDLSMTAVKKFGSYLKPYFVVLTLASIYIIPHGNINPIKYFMGLSYGTWFTIPIQFLPLWFLPHLWAVSLFSYLFIKHSNFGSKSIVFKSACLGVLLCVGYLEIQIFHKAPGKEMYFPLFGLPVSIDLIFISSFYFILGSLLKNYIVNLKLDLIMVVMFISSAFLFIILHLYYDFTMDLNLRRYDNIFISTAEALTGIYIVLSSSVLIDRSAAIRKLFVYIGSGSLFILIFHFWVQMDSAKIIYSLIDDRHYVIRYSIIKYLSLTLAILLPLLFFELVKRSRILQKLFLPAKAAGIGIIQTGDGLPPKSGNENLASEE